MAKIKNMGTATMRFGEGVIVTGSVGNDTKTLVVDGGAKVTNNFTVSGDGGFDNAYVDDELVVGTVYNSLRVSGSAFLSSSEDVYSGDGSGEYSVSLWYKSADQEDENRIIFTLANSNARSTVREKGGALQYLASADDNTTCVSGFSYYPDEADNWNFLTFVSKQNGANLETTASLNGAITDADSVAGKTAIMNYSSNTIRKLQIAGFTSDSDTIGNEMHIRDFILWDGSLSADDITTLYNSGNPYNFRNFTTYDKLVWLKPDEINQTSLDGSSTITNFGSAGGDFEVVDYGVGKIVEVNTDAPFTDPTGASLTVATDATVHGDLVVSGNMRLSDTVNLGISGSNIFGVDADNEMHVTAGGVLSYKVKNDGNVEFQTAVTSSHFKVEGSGGQFVAFNEDTVKLKHVNWYSSNDRQYGQGQLWYQQWFGAVEPSDSGAQGGRRIGFFFHEPNFGASDADGGTSTHPTNTHAYFNLDGMTLQTGSLDVTAGTFSVTGSDGNSGAASFEDYIMAELSIPGLDIQNDTNAFTFNCPYDMVFEQMDIYMDTANSTNDLDVDMINVDDSSNVIFDINNIQNSGNTVTSDTSPANASVSRGDRIRFRIANVSGSPQGCRANVRFRRLI